MTQLVRKDRAQHRVDPRRNLAVGKVQWQQGLAAFDGRAGHPSEQLGNQRRQAANVVEVLAALGMTVAVAVAIAVAAESLKERRRAQVEQIDVIFRFEVSLAFLVGGW